MRVLYCSPQTDAIILGEKKKMGAYAMERVAAGAVLPTPLAFCPSRTLTRYIRLLPGHQTIEPTTA